MQNNNNYAIAYYRYSSHSQNEASIEQQKEQAHLYAEKHGLTIIKEYEDKAISGTTDERPAFQQMLSDYWIRYTCTSSSFQIVLKYPLN